MSRIVARRMISGHAARGRSGAARLWSGTDRTAAMVELHATWVAPLDCLRAEVPASALEALAPGPYLITVIVRGEEEAAEGWLHVLTGIEP